MVRRSQTQEKPVPRRGCLQHNARPLAPQASLAVYMQSQSRDDASDKAHDYAVLYCCDDDSVVDLTHVFATDVVVTDVWVRLLPQTRLAQRKLRAEDAKS
uniref:Uncharacterized protein n=1 Tax=Lygus hesperus TaxID=30085 RepID=A0A0A9YFE6_LYGHE